MQNASRPRLAAENGPRSVENVEIDIQVQLHLHELGHQLVLKAERRSIANTRSFRREILRGSFDHRNELGFDCLAGAPVAHDGRLSNDGD